jgi:energy-converting hydrogenase Eha subunit C
MRHSFLQVLNMLLGPLTLLACGILLVMLSERHDVLVMYSRLVDPIISCCLFLSYLFMIVVPSKNTGNDAFSHTLCQTCFLPVHDVMHLVLQANPAHLKSNEIERLLRDKVRCILY